MEITYAFALHAGTSVVFVIYSPGLWALREQLNLPARKRSTPDSVKKI